MIKILLLAVVPFMTQHRNVAPKTEVSTNFYGSVTGIVDNAYIQTHGGAVDTNAVIDIANATIATNPVVVGKLDKTDGIGSISWNNGSLDANAATVSCGGGFTTPYDFQIKESPSAQPTHALSAKANRAEYGDADEIATLDADGNPTRSGIAKANVATKTDLDNYLPLTGGELSGGVYAQQAIASATTVGAQMIDAWADIRLGSETYYLHNEDECLADYNGKFAHESMISATDPTFSNAVLAVGLNIDTNSVAVLNEIAATFGGFPIEGTATTVGGLLAALAAAAAWLKKNKVQTLKLNDNSIETSADGGVAKLDDFFTESNSLLNGRLSYSRNATGLKDRAFNTLSFDGTEYNLSTALAAVTPTASGQPRDLLIVATATAATTISFTAGTIKGDKPTVDGSGTWLITLTEYASGVWYCRQIKMEDAA